MADRLMSPGELADYLAVPLRTVYRWREHRAGPPGIKVGRHVRYVPEDVRAWLDQQRAAGQSPASPDLGAAADQVRTGGRRARRPTGVARP